MNRRTAPTLHANQDTTRRSLTWTKTAGNLSDVKKTARQVLRSWGRIVQTLKPGQTIEVTAHGKPLVNITKPVSSPRTLPDFQKLARRAGLGDSKLGDRLLKRLLASTTIWPSIWPTNGNNA